MTRSFTAAVALALLANTSIAVAQEGNVFPPINPSRNGTIMRVSAPQTSQARGNNAVSVLSLLGLGVAGLALLASGAGGGDNDTTTAPPPPTPEQPGPTRPITTIEEEPEYRINPALISARASHKYAQGLTGKGVRIGVLDNGIQNNPDLEGAVDRTTGYYPYGTAYIATDGPLRHGTAVAQIIAGRRNASGSHGLAYEATLIDLATGTDERDGLDSSVVGNSGDFAPGISAGLRAGARLFNASFGYAPGTTTPTQSVDSFRTRLRQNGVYPGLHDLARNDAVMIVGTGNDGTLNPSLLATSGLMDEFNGHIIAVTSITPNGVISGFATRCGILQEFCLAAVGENIPVVGSNGVLEGFTGTSAATPAVTGAIALLRQEFPELSAPATAQIVLDTARDLGEPGTDAVYGRGALDLSNALTPQGTLRIAASDDVTKLSYTASSSSVRAQGAMAPTLHALLEEVPVMVYDAYTRGFDADLGSFVTGTLSDSPLPKVDLTVNTSQGITMRSFGEDGALASLEWGTSRAALGYGQADLFASATRATSVRTGYSPLGALDDAINLAYQHGDRGPIIGAHVDGDDGFALWADGHIATGTRAGFGLMRERDQVLGTSFSGAMGANAHATTVFADVATTATLTPQWSLAAQGTLAHTRFSQDGIFQEGSFTSASAEVSATYTDTRGIHWTAFAGTPLGIHAGSLTLDLPSDRLPGTDGDSSSGVGRRQDRLHVDGGQAPLDLGLRITRTTPRATLSATTGARLHQDDTDPFAGVGVALRF